MLRQLASKRLISSSTRSISSSARVSNTPPGRGQTDIGDGSGGGQVGKEEQDSIGNDKQPTPGMPQHTRTKDGAKDVHTPKMDKEAAEAEAKK